MLMDVKMPTIFGYFNIYEHCEFHANVCWAWKMFLTNVVKSAKCFTLYVLYAK